MFSTLARKLAWRYLLSSRYTHQISTMVMICLAGIAIGSGSLALVASIMSGFEKVTHEKMQGIHSPIIIRAYGQELNTKKLLPTLEAQFPEIRSASPRGEKQVIVKSTDDDTHDIIVLRGINPQTEALVSTIGEKIIAPTNNPSLDTVVRDNTILIGHKLAESLGVVIGESLELLYTEDEAVRSRSVKLTKHVVTIGGIFKTGIQEFDAGVGFAPLSLLTKHGIISGPTEVGVSVQKVGTEQTVIEKMRGQLNLEVYSWKDFYTPLVAALKLEKYAMFFILALITLVASMNIISVLFMQIIEKRSDIALFQALGMAHNDIRSIFIYLGLSIAFIGSIVGLGGAFLTGLALQNFNIIELPDAYYATHLPVHMSWSIFGTVFLVVMGLSFITTWWASHKTKSLSIATILRFEG